MVSGGESGLMGAAALKEGHSNTIFTVRDIVDDTGVVIKSMEFSEYGNLISSSGSGTISPKTWIGGLSVNDDTADSGLYLMGHRHYLGGHIGRFISRDPIGFAGGLNLYSYAGASPVSSVDPKGLNPIVGLMGALGCIAGEYYGSPTYEELPTAERDIVDAALNGIYDVDRALASDIQGMLLDGTYRFGANNWPMRAAITWPIGIQVDRADSCDTPGSTEWKIAVTAALLVHERHHWRDPYYAENLLKYPVNRDPMELSAYTAERNFLQKWQSVPGLTPQMSAAITSHLASSNATITNRSW